MSEELDHWSANPVTWIQLVISVTGLLLVLAGTLVILESRLTRLEERQAMNLKRLSEQEITITRNDLMQEAKFVEIRRELVQKLDAIGADIVVLKIQFAVRQGSK